MTETEREAGVLSREELDAILEALAGAASEERAPFRREDESRSTGALVRALRDFAEEESRALSVLHQRSLRFSLLAFAPVGSGDLADSLLESDLVAVLELEPGAATGYLVLSRPLLFCWLTLAFGARAGMPHCGVPRRPYSRIEERFLLRVAAEIAAQLELSLSRSRAVRVRVVELIEPRLVPRQGPERLRMATFDVAGFEEIGRMRLVLPEGLLEGGRDAPAAAREASHSPLRGQILPVPVRVHAEVGTAELPLGRFAALREGDVLPLEPADPAGLVVCVENEPKFRAERGALGRRLAVQLLERL